MSTIEQQAAELQHSALGKKGVILVTDGTAITGKFTAIKAITDCTFTTLTSNITKNGTTTAAVAADFGTLVAGDIIYGKITAVTRATGSYYLIV